MKTNFVFEKFEDFLLNQRPLNEKKEEGTPLDISGAEELVDKIIELDINLAEAYIKAKAKDNLTFMQKAKDAVGIDTGVEDSHRTIYNLKAVEALKEGRDEDAVVYAIMANGQRKDFEDVYKKMGIDLNYNYPKGTKEAAKKEDKKKKFKDFADKIEDMDREKVRSIAEEVIKSWKGKSESLLGQAYSTPLLWGMLSDPEKKKVYEDFYNLAVKRGYETTESLGKIIDRRYSKSLGESYRLYSPGIQVSLVKEETVIVSPPVPTKTYIVDQEKESEVFQPNKTGVNGQIDFIEDSFQQIVDNLGSLFERYKAGEITSIKKISILTSADRYRNQYEAEKLSWGELAYARGITMSKLIEGVAKAAGLDDKVTKGFPAITTIYAKGSNGDGTSGPNPPEGKKFGYYVKGPNGTQWVEGKDRNSVVIIPIDEEGTPTSKDEKTAKIVSMAPEASVSGYNQFRYNNIEIEFEMVRPGKILQDSDKIVNLKYPVLIRIPNRYSSTTIKIPLPVISKSYSSSGEGKGGGNECPSFAGTFKTKYGLTFKTINVLTYKSDLTKDLF